MSRFSRSDGILSVAEMQRVAAAGIALWWYQDGQPFAYGEDAGVNIGTYVKAEMNAEYRRQIAKHTKEAGLRKAKAGHVVGGRAFGFDHVCSVCDRQIPARGRRCCLHGHTERRVNQAQAAIIVRIATLYASGLGYSGIAQRLSADGVPTPTGRSSGWGPSTIEKILRNPLYRGEVVYNRTGRRIVDGAAQKIARPASEWVRREGELRIGSADLWRQVDHRVAAQQTDANKINKSIFPAGPRRRQQHRDAESPYLLSGFLRCATCGSSVSVLSGGRVYGCIGYHKKGTTVCRNGLRKPLAVVDEAIRRRLSDLLVPAALQAIVDGVLAKLTTPTLASDLAQRRQALTKLDTEIARLTEAIAVSDGALPSLLEALQARQAKRAGLVTDLAAQATVDVTRYDRRDIQQRVDRCVTRWRTELTADIPRARQTLRELFSTPLRLTPTADGYRFEGELSVGKLLVGDLGLPTFATPGTRSAQGWTLPFSGIAA
jgi:DNA invertase Pin-like site-specific DNA recombinase